MSAAPKKPPTKESPKKPPTEGVALVPTVDKKLALRRAQLAAREAKAVAKREQQTKRKARLAELEARIEEHAPEARRLYDATRALPLWADMQEIRDNHLYKEAGFTNFADYCLQKWNLSRSYVDRLIQLYQAHHLLTPIGVSVENEGQAREWGRLLDNPKALLTAGKEAKTLQDDGKLTALAIRGIVTKHYEPPGGKPRQKFSDNRVVKIADKALTATIEAFKRLRSHDVLTKDDVDKVLEQLLKIQAFVAKQLADAQD